MRRVTMLKSPDYQLDRSRLGTLPYRVDQLADAGYEPVWTDRNLRPPFQAGRLARLMATSESVATPWMQTVFSTMLRRRSDVVLAMFESEGHGLALVRRLLAGRQRPPLVILSCWLTDLLVGASARRRRLYRWLYREVDHVIVLSTNQIATLERELGLPPGRVTAVRFGVDLDELSALQSSDEGRVAAIGRDRGRDWRCLAAAAAGSSWDVDLITRAQQLEGVELPSSITVHPPVSRDLYLEVLRRASVVVLPSEVREYPTGQTVLLEAMALGKACVVTDTPAMREYVSDGTTGVLVPPGDPDALRRAVDALLADEPARQRLGGNARAQTIEWGGTKAMWRDVAHILDLVVDGSPSGRTRR